ncbi:hypothetical protein [Sphingobium yanoikuyae]|jgi:hypothetical protein
MAYAGFRARSGDYGVIPGAARLTLPPGLDPTGLEWVHFMTHGVEKALRNWAPGKPDATLTGTPIELDGCIQFRSGSAYMTTHLTDSGQTISHAIGGRDIGGQADNADRFFWGGSGFAGPPTIQGANLYTSEANKLQFATHYNNGEAPIIRNVVLDVPGGPDAPMRLALASAAATGATGTSDDATLDEFIAGVSGANAVAAGYNRNATGAKFMIGHGASVTLTGSGQVWCSIGFSRLLTTNEKLILKNWLINTGRAHGHYAPADTIYDGGDAFTEV